MGNMVYAGQECELLRVKPDLAVAPTQNHLTTYDGQIVDADGELLDLNGAAWFGFSEKPTMVDGLHRVRVLWGTQTWLNVQENRAGRCCKPDVLLICHPSLCKLIISMSRTIDLRYDYFYELP